MKIAVFYHAKLEGEGIPSESLAINIFATQVRALELSGLTAAADSLIVGMNGNRDYCAVCATLLPPKAKVVYHGEARGEYPTMKLMQDWLPGHEDWLVFYHHTKGVSHARDDYARWRNCMEVNLVYGWTHCVQLLSHPDVDTVGAHWCTPEKYPIIHKGQRFWGGNFWWAKASFLQKLPPLPPTDTTNGRYYLGEVWIGTGPRPRYVDLANHFPMKGC